MLYDSNMAPDPGTILSALGMGADAPAEPDTGDMEPLPDQSAPGQPQAIVDVPGALGPAQAPQANGLPTGIPAPPAPPPLPLQVLQQRAQQILTPPPATTAPDLSMMGLSLNQIGQDQEKARELLASFVANPLEAQSSGGTTGRSALEDRSEDVDLLTPWRRALITADPGDLVQKALNEKFGTGKKGAAKQFLYDFLAGGAYGTGSRGILSANIQREREYSLKLLGMENQLKAQQITAAKAAAAADVAARKLKLTADYQSTSLFRSSVDKEQHLAEALAKLDYDQKARDYELKNKLPAQMAKLVAETEMIRARSKVFEETNGIQDPRARFATVYARNDVKEQFGFNPDEPPAGTDPEQVKRARQLAAERYLYWITRQEQALEAGKPVKETKPIIRATPGRWVLNKGNSELVRKSAFAKVDPSGKIEIMLEDIPGMETVGPGRDLTTFEQQTAEFNNEFIQGSKKVWGAVADSYLKYGKGVPLSKANLPLNMGPIRGSDFYQWLYNSGLVGKGDALDQQINNALGVTQQQIEGAKRIRAMTGAQSSDKERAFLLRAFGTSTNSVYRTAALAAVNHYMGIAENYDTVGGPEEQRIIKEMGGRGAFAAFAAEYAMDQLEMGEPGSNQFKSFYDVYHFWKDKQEQAAKKTKK